MSIKKNPKKWLAVVVFEETGDLGRQAVDSSVGRGVAVLAWQIEFPPRTHGGRGELTP